MTSTRSAPSGAWPDVAKIARIVGTAMKTRIRAGASVHPISSAVWPCTVWGERPGSRAKPRERDQQQHLDDHKDDDGHQKMFVKSPASSVLKSDRGANTDCGNWPLPRGEKEQEEGEY